MDKKGAIDSVRLNVVHHPGRHCASTGIRDLVNFHGIDFSEAMCFGIGAGLGLWYLDFEGLPVSRMMHVRSMDFEAQFFSRMGMAFEWEQTNDPAAGEAALCHHLDNGRPAIVQTDIYYLSHYSGNTHFPGHLITVWGYDGTQDIFFITDTQFPDLIAVPFADMRQARFFRDAIFHLRGNLYAPETVSMPRDMADVVRNAVIDNSRALTGDASGVMGIQALEKMRDELALWKDFNDWQWTCRFTYQVIEKRGTGGGGFRLMYADFLEEAAGYVAKIRDLGLSARMHETGLAWQRLALAFKAASEKQRPELGEVRREIEAVIRAESAYHEVALKGLSL